MVRPQLDPADVRTRVFRLDHGYAEKLASRSIRAMNGTRPAGSALSSEVVVYMISAFALILALGLGSVYGVLYGSDRWGL
jgi:hypothetical protein